MESNTAMLCWSCIHCLPRPYNIPPGSSLVLNISQCSDLLQVLRAQYNWWWFLAPLGLGIIWAIRQSGPIESTIRSLHRHRRPGITTGHKGHVPLKPFPLGFISSNMGLGQRAWHMYSLIICFNSSSDSLQGLCFILAVCHSALSVWTAYCMLWIAKPSILEG